MKLAIVYNDDLPVNKLIEKAEKYFDKVLALPVEGLRYVFDEEGNKAMYKDANLCDFDAVYLRIHDFDLFFMEQIIEILKENNVYMQMEPDSGLVASNKFLTMMRLRENGIPVADSVYALSPEVAVESTKSLGYPVAVKLLSGYGGKGVMRASEKQDLRPLMDTLEMLEQSICLQDFIEGKTKNVRIVVVGDKTFSMKFVPEEDEWRASPGSGGKKRKYDASEDVRGIALEAAKVSGFDLCDVDLILSEKGIYVVEIDLIQVTDDEACELTGTDLRDEIMFYIQEKVMDRKSGLDQA
ncbi:MAG: RimK family alpha-L-glutamate ligase [Candidatus Aenigmatarchaeota archaeon]